jgi:hypothetical protein
MTAQLVTIEKALPECLDDVLEILSRVNLPRDGVKEHFGGFLIARSGGGKILGCVSTKANGSAISSSRNSLNERRVKGSPN